MTGDNSGPTPRQVNLTDEEAVTLRRVAFGESEVRTLRRADVARLLRLRLVEEVKDGIRLTIAGKEHFDSLPRTVFAGQVRQRIGQPPPGPAPHPRDRADRQWQMLSGARTKDPQRR
jgi:hypothetical protein